MIRYFPRIFFVLVSSLAAVGCGPDAPDRGHDPWVFRSVMDEKPRMLTMALRDSFWVSYDAKNASLYKVWRDGVSFDGAVFNTAHGPQPTSLGPAFLISEVSEPWYEVSGTDTLRPSVQYRGHVFEGDKVSLQTDLTLKDGSVVRVVESPEMITDPDQNPGLERTFSLSGSAGTSKILLDVDLGSSNAVVTTQISADDKKTWKDGQQSGFVTMPTAGNLVVTLQFGKDPAVLPAVTGIPEDLSSHPGRALIAESDCQTCHNDQVRTVGPSYLEIAQKYPYTSRQVADMMAKVIGGGSGVWGDVPMTPHPDIPAEDVEQMVSYVLSLDGEELREDPLDVGESYPLFGQEGPPDDQQGLVVNAYRFEPPVENWKLIGDKDIPVHSTVVPAIHAPSVAEFGDLTTEFYLSIKGTINVPVDGNYVFRLISDDGSFLYLDDVVVIDNDGLHGADAREAELFVSAGPHPIAVRYFQFGGGLALSLQWRKPGDTGFSVIPPEVFSYDAADLKDTKPYEPPVPRRIGIPGDRTEVAGVHPAFTLETIRPESFQPKVGALDVLPDGRVVVTTWDEIGGVYLLDKVDNGDPEKITVKRIAEGLAEPLGIKAVDGDLYVLQKHELTRLIDHDGDDVIDEYETVSNSWNVSANFHEFAFGLVFKDGYFYATLATAILPGGASANPQILDRGRVMRISQKDGSLTFVASGLRTPNGIGFGVDDEIFVADNQGDWLPSSKIVHVVDGAFYGSRSVDFEGTAGLSAMQPVVWLPQDEIGNSPSQPAPLNVGPYVRQMIHGEVTHGGLKRVYAEKVNGQYQGAVFRFMQGLEAGINRTVWGPDGKLYVGGIGNPGNWGHEGKNWYGLQRLTYSGGSAFEMLTVEARSNGFEITFTEPLQPNDGFDPASYEVQQWRYAPDANYGGPKVDLETLPVKSVSMAEDRKRVFLEIEGLKAGHVVYLHLLEPWLSASNNSLWTTEAWYTLNAIPADKPGFVSDVRGEITGPNQLSRIEKEEGWELLFNGKDFSGWKGYRKNRVGSDWRIEDNAMTAEGEVEDWYYKNGGDILTTEQYENFELRLDWKMEPGANSGIMYFVNEDPAYKYTFETGPEMQILDNDGHGDGQYRTHRAGDLYDLIESDFEAARPPGMWNRVRLIVNDGVVEHWLNGHRVLQYDMDSAEFKERIRNSKFGEMPGFAASRSGHIALQDHGNRVWFRNVKIKKW